ncbi:MAG: hypothetical protein LiPW15_503 [Parcubacteria group bacterium LiPW_15]|nr:MAG: hypothetical protein LiPW15_503 [Parcubacteria group bacterium LiPW_15]
MDRETEKNREMKCLRATRLPLGRLATADPGENTVVSEPAAGIAQVEPAVLGVTVHAQNVTVAVRVQPRLVEENHVRLLARRRSSALLGETKRMLLGRPIEASGLEELEALFLGEGTAGVDDLDLDILRMRLQREVCLCDVVVHVETRFTPLLRDLVGRRLTTELHPVDLSGAELTLDCGLEMELELEGVEGIAIRLPKLTPQFE